MPGRKPTARPTVSDPAPGGAQIDHDSAFIEVGDGLGIPTPSSVVQARAPVAVWEVGSGGTIAVLLHGFPDHAVGFLSLANALAASGVRCVVPALPGYWPSEPVAGADYSVSAVAADILVVMDALGIEQATVIGHDWGAELGYHLGSHSPDRLDRLVAIGAPHPAGYAIRRRVFSEHRTAWYAMVLAYVRDAAEIASQPEWLTALSHSWSPGLHREDWPVILRLLRQPGVMQAICEYYRSDLDEALAQPQVAVPTTIIHGGQDGCIGPMAYQSLDEWFSAGLKLVTLPSVGHWPHLEAPAETSTAIAHALSLSSHRDVTG